MLVLLLTNINGPTVMGNAQGLKLQEKEIIIDSTLNLSVKINVLEVNYGFFFFFLFSFYGKRLIYLLDQQVEPH